MVARNRPLCYTKRKRGALLYQTNGVNLMILAEKIIKLRKKNGWSQEELAEKLNVSRQAVSKWEGAQTVPDIGKILQLSELFGVSTDYLLKDEMEAEEFTEQVSDSPLPRVTLEQANAYLAQRKKASVQIAFATFLCILSPIPLLILSAASESPAIKISESAAAAIGVPLLLVIVTIAVALFIFCGFQNAPFAFLEKEPFEAEYGVTGMVSERKAAYFPTYVKGNIIGTCICILSPIPLLVGAFLENGFLLICLLCVTMFIAAIGASCFIVVGVRYTSMQKLLKEGEFQPVQTENSKQEECSKQEEALSSVYWLLTTALYLTVSFLTGRWGETWIIWPIAAVLYAAILSVYHLVVKK